MLKFIKERIFPNWKAKDFKALGLMLGSLVAVFYGIHLAEEVHDLFAILAVAGVASFIGGIYWLTTKENKSEE